MNSRKSAIAVIIAVLLIGCLLGAFGIGFGEKELRMHATNEGISSMITQSGYLTGCRSLRSRKPSLKKFWKNREKKFLPVVPNCRTEWTVFALKQTKKSPESWMKIREAPSSVSLKNRNHAEGAAITTRAMNQRALIRMPLCTRETARPNAMQLLFCP